MRVSLWNRFRTFLAMRDLTSACRSLDKVALSGIASSLYLSLKGGVGSVYYTSSPEQRKELHEMAARHLSEPPPERGNMNVK